MSIHPAETIGIRLATTKTDARTREDITSVLLRLFCRPIVLILSVLSIETKTDTDVDMFTSDTINRATTATVTWHE
jgi:hypothetical protein